VADVPANSAPSSGHPDLKPIEEEAPIPSPAPSAPLKRVATSEPEEVGIRIRKPASANDPANADWLEDGEEVEETASPVRTKSRRGEAISARPQGRPPAVELEDEEEEKAPRPRKFKSRKRKLIKKRSPGGLGFIRWVVASVVYVLVGAGTAAHMIYKGHVEELILHSVEWAILMPVTVVIFVGSMFIGSAIAGGIDFGDARWAIPKALYILAPVNFLYVMLPGFLGFLLGLPFWIGSLMLLFDLEVWEAKFIIVINWILGRVAMFLIVLITLSMLHGMEMRENEDLKSDGLGDDQMNQPVNNDPPPFRGDFRR
jgi:hypothetical protein